MARPPVPQPQSLQSHTQISSELNGVFLAPALARETPNPAMLLIHRYDQMRRLGGDRVLQSSFGNFGSRLDREMILGQSNLLPFDFLRSGDKIGRAVSRFSVAMGQRVPVSSSLPTFC